MDCWIGVVTENDRRVVRLAGTAECGTGTRTAHGLRRQQDPRTRSHRPDGLWTWPGLKRFSGYAPEVPPCSERPATSSSRSTLPAVDRSPRQGRIPGADPVPTPLTDAGLQSPSGCSNGPSF